MRNNFRSNRKRQLFAAVLLSVLFVCNRSFAQVYLDSTATIESRVDDLLSRMSRDEKIGQMIQMNYPNLPSMSDIKTYYLGSLLAYADVGPLGRTPQAWADLYDMLQSYALQTRLRIPLIFAIDAIHGFWCDVRRNCLFTQYRFGMYTKSSTCRTGSTDHGRGDGCNRN